MGAKQPRVVGIHEKQDNRRTECRNTFPRMFQKSAENPSWNHSRREQAVVQTKRQNVRKLFEND